MLKILAGALCGGVLVIAALWAWAVRSFHKGPF